MRWGTAIAKALCAACICAAAPGAAGQDADYTARGAGRSAAPADSLAGPEAAPDTVKVTIARPGSAEAAGDTVYAREIPEAPVLVPRVKIPVRVQVETSAYKSLWELLALRPELRWNGGSGSLGGVEALSIRGRLMRHPALMYGGFPLGVDLNTVAPANVDSAWIMAGIPLHEEVLMNGAEGVDVSSSACGGGPREGYVFLSRGELADRFSELNYRQCGDTWRFRLNLAGAAYPRVASYEAYTRDGGTIAIDRGFRSGLSLGLRATRFRSRLIRYTGVKTKTRLESIDLKAGAGARRDLAWRARAFYLGSRYSYMDVGPQSGDEIWSAGCALDVWPGGTDGGHRVSLGLRRESLERSIMPFPIPEELLGYGSPDQGTRRSFDASGAYSIEIVRGESRFTGLVRADRKELFGWSPTFAAGVRRALGSWGAASLEGQRSSFMPGFLEIYGPRDETARPTWYMARGVDPETEWSMSLSLSGTRGRWTGRLAGFGALRDHILAPPPEWLGLNGETTPVITTPIEDAGSGSTVGAWVRVEWATGPGLALGGAYSAQRGRVEERATPFQPSHKLEAWARGERSYFGGDLKVGVVLRGFFYSPQATYLESELASFGAADATGYVSLSDMVFYYQIKNLETRPRPSAVLDLQSGRYLLQPGPEVRLGLVWYLPG